MNVLVSLYLPLNRHGGDVLQHNILNFPKRAKEETKKKGIRFTDLITIFLSRFSHSVLPVAPQESHQGLGDDGNFMFRGQMPVELRYCHYNLKREMINAY